MNQTTPLAQTTDYLTQCTEIIQSKPDKPALFSIREPDGRVKNYLWLPDEWIAGISPGNPVIERALGKKVLEALTGSAKSNTLVPTEA